ncbi:MAG: aminopeptidase [Clostridia bacterium]|nr:aminopeptidase [Clostridia bacterium]
MAEKSKAKALKEELFYQPKHMATVVEDDLFPKADLFAEGYKAFMSNYKTEREITAYFQAEAEKRGYTEFDKTKTYKPGDRVYRVNRNKSIILTVFGKKPLSEGLRIAASHIDSPRLDLKPNPLYEKDEMAFFKTHYYGGIKKYQWTTIPLSLHGVIVKGDGTTVTVNIGEDEGDPLFVITDLLPHLAKNQENKKLGEAIKGEDLNVLVGSLPFKGDEESDLVKLNILKILHEKYGIVEKDFLTAELEMVPAFKARDVGFDRSLIAAYGHDDKVCSYPSAMANFEVEDPCYTIVTILTDKEEIGSDGNTGLNSSYFKYFVEDLGENAGIPGHDILSKSECLSADVTAGMDPTYPEPMEANNASYISKGVCICKYTGSRGKYSTSDATAEFFGKVRRLLDEQGIVWQTGELGKVDAGGGGTVAMYLAALDIDVIDIGTPVLSMHSPYEIISKLDLYSTYQAMYAFFRQ